ncbi:MAG: hypothetical protein LQ337_003043 [Flavoplaca oasis]|nr:MAG: hypothetical protein LQ337_003043 [Flavoplaca oasis]
MSTNSTSSPNFPPPSHHSHQQDQPHKAKQHGAEGEQAVNEALEAMILVKDHTSIAVKSLVRINFPIVELRAKEVTKQKKEAVMLIMLGTKENRASYGLIRFEHVSVLAKFLYSHEDITEIRLHLEMLPEAAHEPEMQERAITAFEELRGLARVDVHGFSPKTAGTALKKVMESPLQNMTQGSQRIEAFRYRIALEMVAWEHKSVGDLQIFERLKITLEAAIRCMDKYHTDLRDCGDWEPEHFIDRKIFLLTELVYTEFVCCAAEKQNLKHARECLLRLKNDGAPAVALAVIHMRLCSIEMRRNHPKRAARYIAKVEKVQPDDKHVQMMRRMVDRMPGKADAT